MDLPFSRHDSRPLLDVCGVMDCSLGELESLVRQAVRGAGYHWGHAEESAAAVRWLESVGLPGAAVLCARLQRVAAGVPGTRQSCPIVTSSLILDKAIRLHARVEIPRLEDPLLLVPMIMDLAELRETSVSIAWSCNGNVITFTSTGKHECRASTTDTILCTTHATQLTLTLAPARPCERDIHLSPHNRAVVADQHLRLLDQYAALLRAPATEESRLRGAGDG